MCYYMLMPQNMGPKEFGASVAHQYISEPVVKTVAQEEINEVVEKPEIVSAIHVDKTDRITISPEEIKAVAAPSPEKETAVVEEDVVPYKI